MFFFGFLLLLCAMQLPGLPFLRAIKGPLGHLIRIVPTVGFAAALGGCMASGCNDVRVFGVLGIPLAEWMIAYFVPLMLYLTLHPMFFCSKEDGAPSTSSFGRGFAWFVFYGSLAAAIIGGVIDWHLPYAAWLKDPSVQPRTFVFSYIGMSVATLGMLWAPARLLQMPPRASYKGGCCGPTVCCVKKEEGDEEAAKGTEFASKEFASIKGSPKEVPSTPPTAPAMADH